MARPYRGPVTYRGLILAPVLITLGVTIVRLIGELANGPAWLFGREARGGGALVGITWLVPIFAIYFAVKQVNRDFGPSSFGRAIIWFLLALIVTVASAIVPALLGYTKIDMATLLIAAAACVVGIVMLVAMIGDWGTHYDVAPPGFPEMGVLSKWFLIGVIPQLTTWIAFTVVIGGTPGRHRGRPHDSAQGKRETSCNPSLTAHRTDSPERLLSAPAVFLFQHGCRTVLVEP